MGLATAQSMPNRAADAVVPRTMDWIGRQSGKFFAWVHLFDPHSPYTPPEDLRARYSDQPYFGEVAFVDRALGPLFDRLRSLTRPTLVLVTSDHGESLGEHGELTHGMFAYEATLRVPLIVAVVDPAEKRAPRGVVIDAPVRHVDLAPTVLEAAGETVPTGLAGAPIQPLLRGGAAPDRPAYFEAMTYNLVRGWAPLRGVLVGRDKYIDLPMPELYDLAADPSESRNLAVDARDRMAVLGNVLRGYNTAPPQRPGREAADVAATLRSLGYITGSAPARTSYTEADDPKRLVDIDRTSRRHAACAAGPDQRGHHRVHARHREARGHGGRLHAARLHLLRVGAGRAGDRHARAGTPKWGARSRAPHPAGPVPG
jgi:hypothetical protein